MFSEYDHSDDNFTGKSFLLKQIFSIIIIIILTELLNDEMYLLRLHENEAIISYK